MADLTPVFIFLCSLASTILFLAFYFRQKSYNYELSRRIEALEHRQLTTEKATSPSNLGIEMLTVRTPQDTDDSDPLGRPSLSVSTDDSSCPSIAMQAAPDEDLSAALVSALAEIHSALSALPSDLPTRLKTLESSLTDLQTDIKIVSTTGTTTGNQQSERRIAAVSKLRDFQTTIHEANYKFAEMMQAVSTDDVEGATLARLTALDIIVRHQQLALIPLFNNMRDQAYRRANGVSQPY